MPTRSRRRCSRFATAAPRCRRRRLREGASPASWPVSRAGHPADAAMFKRDAAPDVRLRHHACPPEVDHLLPCADRARGHAHHHRPRLFRDRHRRGHRRLVGEGDDQPGLGAVGRARTRSCAPCRSCGACPVTSTAAFTMLEREGVRVRVTHFADDHDEAVVSKLVNRVGARIPCRDDRAALGRAHRDRGRPRVPRRYVVVARSSAISACSARPCFAMRVIVAVLRDGLN